MTTLLLRDLDTVVDPREPNAFPRQELHRETGLLTWLRKAERGLYRDYERLKVDDSRVFISNLLALVEICMGEELAITGKETEAVAVLQSAKQKLSWLVKGYRGLYEHQAMLIYIDCLLTLKLQSDGKTKEAVDQMKEVLKRARDLAETQWGVDDYGMRVRTWYLVARCSKWLGDWVSEHDKQAAAKYYREALDALNNITIDPGRTELPLRVQTALLGEEIAQTIGLLDLDPKLAQEALERVRKELEGLAPHVGDVAWLRKARGICDVLLGAVLVVQEKDSLLLLDQGIAQIEKYLKDYPDDQLARFHLGTGHFARGGNLALINNKVEEGLREVEESRKVLAKIHPKGGIAPAAKALDRQAASLVVSLHWMAAEELLEANKPEATRKALEHAEAGLKGLADIQKNDELLPVEKQAQEQLKNLKTKAEEQLKKK
jgi:hypothetical protein